MADGGTIDLNKLKQVVDVETILDKRKLNAVLKTLETSLSGENISKYFKGTDALLDDLQEAYKKFNRSMSDTDAKNLVNLSNILKALKVDTTSLVPNFEEIGNAIEKAEQKSKGLRGIIKVQDFKDVFVALNQFKEFGLDIEEIFGKLGAKGNFSELTKQLEQQAQTIERYKNRVSALRDELRDAESASGVGELRNKLNNITSDAKDVFEAFLKVNNIAQIDEWGSYDPRKFSEYFDAIENGSMSAQQAIARFKAEYGYLLEDNFRNSNNTFGLEQLKLFQDTLDQVLTTVEDFHRKLDALPDDMKDIQSSEKSGQVLFDEEQLKSVLNVFGEIKDSLSSLRSVISDVGDGEELSPLLKSIEKVSEAVSNLNMKINMNIDVGSDSKMEQELQKKMSNALLAYENLREHLFRTYNGDNYASELLYKFDPSQFDTTIGKIEGYKKFIENLRNSIKENYGHDKLFEDSDKSYWTKASAAYGQITKVRNAMKTDTDDTSLDGLFGGKTDLTEVIEQLKLIATELGKVSAAATDIKTSLGEGIQLNDSLQQIETLTQKVKDLETELTSLKSSTHLSSSETNLSSEGSSMEEVKQATDQAVQAKEDFAKANAGVQTSVDESKSPLQLEAELMDQIAESARKAADAKKEFVEANGKVAESANKTATDNQNKQYYEDIVDGAQEAGQSVEKNFSRINELVLVQDNELKNHIATWEILKQVGEFGKDSNVSLRFKRDNGQIENRYYKRNDNGGYDLQTKVSITDYEKITKLIVDADNELRKLEDRKNKILSDNPTASTTGIEEAIRYQREYIKAIEETISYMRQQQEYVLKGPQIDKARDEALAEYTRKKAISNDETNAKNEQKRLEEVQKTTIELQKQQSVIDAIENTYNKNKNKDLDRSVNRESDLNELANKKKEIEDLIASLNGREKSDIAVELSQLKILIDEYKQLAQYKLKANNPSKQELGGQDLQVLLAQQVSYYDKLILKAEKYGDETAEVVVRLKEQRDIISAKNDDGKFTATANQFYAARDNYKIESAGFSSFEASKKSIGTLQDEAIEINKVLDQTKAKLFEMAEGDKILQDSLNSSEWIGKFGSLGTSIEEANKQLKNGDLSAKEYSSAIDKLISDAENRVKALKEEFKSADEAARKIKEDALNSDWDAAIKENKAFDKAKAQEAADAEKEYQNQLKTIRELSAEKQKLQEQDRKSEVNQALKDQLYAYKQIQSIREKIANTEDENLIAELEKQKQVYQEQYLAATKILKNNSDLYNSESRLNELLQIGLKTTQKISEAEIKRNSAADAKKAKEWDDVNAKNQADTWKENQKAIQNYVNAVKKLQDLLAEDKGTGNKAVAIEKQQEKIKQLEEEALNARVIISSMVNPHTSDATTWDAYIKLMYKFRDATYDAKAAVDDVRKSIQAAHSSELESMMKSLNTYDAKMREFNKRPASDRNSQYSEALKNYSDTLTKYRNELEKFHSHPELVDEAELKRLRSMREEVDKAATSFKGLEKGSTAISRDKLIVKISDYMKKNSAMSKEFKSELEGLIQKLKILGAEADVTNIADDFFKVSQRIREAGQEGRKFFDVVKEKAWYGLAGTIGTYFGFNDFIQYGKQAAQTVRELDTAYTEMRKVSTESAASLKEYQKESFNTANAVGTTSLALQTATADWMRLGESLDDAKESAKDATILLNVSEFDNIEDATQSLVAMSQAYKELGKMEIIDVLDKVGNEFSISTDELSTALKDSAAVLKTQGNTLQQAVAIITAGNAITQDASKTAGEQLPEKYENIFL